MKIYLLFLLSPFVLNAQTPAQLQELATQKKTLENQLSQQQAVTQREKTGLQSELAKLAKLKPDTGAYLTQEKLVEEARGGVRFSETRELTIKSAIEINKKRGGELSLLPKFSPFLKCNDSTPVLNLEEKIPYPGATIKGPFFGVPRDNQDGIGSCFANTAKNLLVGISEGRHVASYLDLALLYKGPSNQIYKTGLDGGTSCPALEEVRSNGYCPQKFAPLETGERSQLGEGLFNHDALTYQSSVVKLMTNFLSNLNTIQRGNGPVKEEILVKAQMMIERVKANPDIILPLPVARFDVPEEWKVNEAHAIKKIAVPREAFLAEYREAYKKFYPIFVKSLLDGKNLDQIFETYKVIMNPFISKYNLQSSLPGFKNVFLINAKKDFTAPNMKRKLRASLDFLKEVMNKKNETDDKFLEFCAHYGDVDLRFLGSLQPLIEQMKSSKFNVNLMFDSKGRFRNATELMQLTVAPSCLSPKNRQKVDIQFYCQEGYDTITQIKSSGKSQNEKIQQMREKVVLSLAQGLPLGNSYPTSSGSGHINTIVGLRFNKQQQKCEYLIRESQTGKSEWQAEEGIFTKINALTEVRK